MAAVTAVLLAHKIEDWHQQRVNELRDLLDLNASKVVLTDKHGNKETLTDRKEIDAYLRGIAYGLDRFLKLPFTIDLIETGDTQNDD